MSKRLFKMIEAVHAKHPGWRFSLLGGDVSMGYKMNKDGSYRRSRSGMVVDEASRHRFGWQAEFFGHIDPRKNYGTRHVSEWAPTASTAITQACRAAMKIPATP